MNQSLVSNRIQQVKSSQSQKSRGRGEGLKKRDIYINMCPALVGNIVGKDGVVSDVHYSIPNPWAVYLADITLAIV